MNDFFAVSHKYRLVLTLSSEPQLFTKSWHLNDIIKKILLMNLSADYTVYVTDTDNNSSDLNNNTVN